jgi:hypothetical protein
MRLEPSGKVLFSRACFRGRRASSLWVDAADFSNFTDAYHSDSTGLKTIEAIIGTLDERIKVF